MDESMTEDEEQQVDALISSLTAKIQAATEDTRRQMDAEHVEREVSQLERWWRQLN